jgi:hypothetical protein
VSRNKNVDEGAGRLEEAAGSLTADDDLTHEGSADRARAPSRTRSTTPQSRPSTSSTTTTIDFAGVEARMRDESLEMLGVA